AIGLVYVSIMAVIMKPMAEENKKAMPHPPRPAPKISIFPAMVAITINKIHVGNTIIPGMYARYGFLPDAFVIKKLIRIIIIVNTIPIITTDSTTRSPHKSDNFSHLILFTFEWI